MAPDAEQPVAPSRRALRRREVRSAQHRVIRPRFTQTMAALEDLASTGAKVSVHVADLDSGSTVLTGDDFVTLPVGGVGVVPLLVEVAARFDDGSLDPSAPVERGDLDPTAVAGIWRHLTVPSLPLADVVVLAATCGDAFAMNALLQVVGIPAVTRRMVSLGMRRSAILDRVREHRGPGDAPHVALGTTREYATLMSDLLAGRVVNAAVSAQVAEWLTLGQDLSLAGARTNLDPFAHEDDRFGLLFLNCTGRADAAVRAEAGAIAGPRDGLAYALTVGFEEASVIHRDRVHGAFRALGADLMENVH